jgi:hypothetical protein
MVILPENNEEDGEDEGDGRRARRNSVTNQPNSSCSKHRVGTRFQTPLTDVKQARPLVKIPENILVSLELLLDCYL